MKKYIKQNYKTFNLGEIHKDYKNKDNKYHGQYKYKIGFGGIIAEYPPNLILVINKTKYFIYKTFYKNKKKH
jgi:lipid II:glycine glycyltransferase (peptidoglycan interpeptide bridge formation enzyme)